MVMIFGVDRVREFLMRNGFVHTFRVHKHKEGKDWISVGRGKPKIADVMIEAMPAPNPLIFGGMWASARSMTIWSGVASMTLWTGRNHFGRSTNLEYLTHLMGTSTKSPS
jgi:hypothetical protein